MQTTGSIRFSATVVAKTAREVMVEVAAEVSIADVVVVAAEMAVAGVVVVAAVAAFLHEALAATTMLKLTPMGIVLRLKPHTMYVFARWPHWRKRFMLFVEALRNVSVRSGETERDTLLGIALHWTSEFCLCGILILARV